MVACWRKFGWGVWVAVGMAVTRIVAAQQPVAPVAPVSATITGTVYDSVGMRPLAEAFVQLVLAGDLSKGASAVADARGRFRFDSVAAGTYLLGFYHAALDSLTLETPLTRVDVRAGGEIRAPLAIPSAATIVARACAAAGRADSSGLLLGRVRTARDATPAANATVHVQWSEITIGARGIERTSQSLQATTVADGSFALCGIPAGASSSVLVRAWAASDSSGFVDLDVPAGGLLRRDLYVGSATTQTVAITIDSSVRDSAGGAITTRVLRGRGALRGTVRGSNGTPIDGARLLFGGSGVEVASSSDGVYRAQALPGGTYMLEARALGYVPVRRPIDIVEGRDDVADFVMAPRAAYLDTVRVLGQRVYQSQQMIEFERRKKSGFGHFMDEDAIEKRNPINVSDLFRMIPGVQVLPSGLGSRVLMRGGGFGSGGYCAPTVFVDGMRAFNESGDLEMIVSASDIRAMEVYSRGSQVPVQFQSMEGCGAVVIWTGGRRPRIPPEPKEKRDE